MQAVFYVCQPPKRGRSGSLPHHGGAMPRMSASLVQWVLMRRYNPGIFESKDEAHLCST